MQTRESCQAALPAPEDGSFHLCRSSRRRGGNPATVTCLNDEQQQEEKSCCNRPDTDTTSSCQKLIILRLIASRHRYAASVAPQSIPHISAPSLCHHCPRFDGHQDDSFPYELATAHMLSHPEGQYVITRRLGTSSPGGYTILVPATQTLTLRIKYRHGHAISQSGAYYLSRIDGLSITR